MSGLVGFTTALASDRIRDRIVVEGMRDLLIGSGRPPEAAYVGDGVAATALASAVGPTWPQPFASGDVAVWLDGEILAAAELHPGARHGAEAIALGYQTTGGFEFLARSDGMFAAVVLDRRCRRLFLLADRLGMRYLFWRASGDQLAWSSELKAFLELPGFAARLDRQAVSHFVASGYHHGDETWFADVRLLGPSTVLAYDLDDHTLETRRYWTPEAIRPLAGKIDVRELLEEMHGRLSAAVERTCEGDHRLGILLSGGLDSRAILASLPPSHAQVPVLTFGTQDCVDFRLARRAAAIRKNPHHLHVVNASNWLAGRVEAVWRTDGLVSLLHTHPSAGLDELRAAMDVNLSGLYLDTTLGGAYLFYEPDHPEWWALLNRGRRSIRAGMRVSEPWIDHRAPGLDHRLIELAMAIPPDLRRGWTIYRRMLLKAFPRYYRTIGWQRSGLPVWAPWALTHVRLVADKVHDRIRRSLGMPGYSWRQYADYPSWLRQDPGQSFARKLLAARDALYVEHVPRESALADLDLHLSGKEYRHEHLGRILTLEIWMRQLAALGA